MEYGVRFIYIRKIAFFINWSKVNYFFNLFLCKSFNLIGYLDQNLSDGARLIIFRTRKKYLYGARLLFFELEKNTYMEQDYYFFEKKKKIII
jgi:hypothetical protein